MTDSEEVAGNPGTAVLREVLERVQRHTGPTPPVVVFDLDATLFDNRPRTLAILHDLASELDPEDPSDAALRDAIGRLRLKDLRYIVADSLANVDMHDPSHIRRATEYWHARFFRDDYIAHDIPMPGALQFVLACYEGGANIVYLTGRDVRKMLVGTVERLRDTGFPFAVPGVEVLLKPTARMGDETFKREAIPAIGRLGEIVAFFDNEPANCNLAAELCPDAALVWLDTQCVPDPPPLAPGVRRAFDFRC